MTSEAITTSTRYTLRRFHGCSFADGAEVELYCNALTVASHSVNVAGNVKKTITTRIASFLPACDLELVQVQGCCKQRDVSRRRVLALAPGWFGSIVHAERMHGVAPAVNADVSVR